MRNPIKFAIIPPLANLELMNQGKIIFALAQLYVRSDQYRDFIKQKKEEGWFIIMDNGAGDHDLIESEDLLAVIIDLMPNEVIPPDVLFNKRVTIDNCKKFVDDLGELGLLDKVDVLFCPQGQTQDEWLEAYQFGLDNKYIKTIGMSKIAIPHAWCGGYDRDQNIMQARHKCYDFLQKLGLVLKPLHFLGAGNPIEFMHYTHLNVRSTDSCFSVLAAINNINWKHGRTDERVPTPKNYFTDLLLTESQLEIFRDNIEVLANICRHNT